MFRILLLQQKPKTGPHNTFAWAHEARGLDIADLNHVCCFEMLQHVDFNLVLPSIL